MLSGCMLWPRHLVCRGTKCNICRRILPSNQGAQRCHLFKEPCSHINNNGIIKHSEIWLPDSYKFKLCQLLQLNTFYVYTLLGVYIFPWVDVLSCARLSSKVNQPKFNQRRISSAKFLGELYNYRMVESAVIFRTLYSFISFGINQDGSPSSLDPPEHLFRIRLVCTLLDTCGQYFDRGSSKRKLDCFLIYFQASWLLMQL